MSTDDNNNPSQQLSFLVRVSEGSVQVNRQRNSNSMLRFLEYTAPCEARLFRERRQSEDEEARAVERANESQAFPMNHRYWRP